MTNPLQKYFRQPKIYISLPSKGNYYPVGSLEGDHSAVPIFAMSGMDELIMKTPDALFNGEATVKLIESCCPYIKDAREVPSIDVDTILSAIRIATFGNKLPINTTCRNCGHQNEYDIDLQTVIDYYINLQFNNKLELADGLTVYFKPISYDQMSKFNIENFALQKTLGQLANITDLNERQAHLDTIYREIANIQVNVFLRSIESVRTAEVAVTDIEYIQEWIANCEREDYDKVKRHLEHIKKDWSMPRYPIKCNECDHEDTTDIVLDQSHFFA